ncbi:anaphase-promoting complex subunit 4 [Gemmobacter caeni]|uniref:Anaphase-promoting complex subunit 4 n=1 Tax=Gemmobacter caeni TaxID=589035 RepID=A0A2T6AZZ2_9RHOB|nr:High-affnity carbon uptake protein Hat/HatR [Gemmobacter caeni]PTX49381.1 anaphase-promoting complex subunit 4 [Gemmobacter caeni]TWJ00322.1 anaphase-promoting complex subunit 4 [Gemmobacter caeni]
MTQTIAPAATPQQPAKAAQSPLFDLLARSWTLEAAITDVALDRAGKAAGFALADGRVALMPLDDPESPLARMRVEADSGRSTIRPREKPVAQPILTPELATGAPLLAPSNMIGLVAAGRDGRIHRVTPRGQVISLCNKAEPIFALAADGLGRLAIARDGRTDLHDEDGMARQAGLLTPGPAHALAFAPDDRSLAVALKESLIIGQPRKGYELFPLGGSGPIGFSADGRWLVGSNGKDGIWLLQRQDGQIARIGKFRAAPTSVTFCRAADAVFASGAFRAAGWSLATPPFGNEATGALKTGRSGLVLIDKVAAHPARDLIALGTADGAVAIAQAGRAEEMPLRQADGAAVTALAWSADGLHLVIGTANGEAALVTLPPQLFK